jgi:hypothetical protein
VTSSESLLRDAQHRASLLQHQLLESEAKLARTALDRSQLSQSTVTSLSEEIHSQRVDMHELLSDLRLQLESLSRRHATEEAQQWSMREQELSSKLADCESNLASAHSLVATAESAVQVAHARAEESSRDKARWIAELMAEHSQSLRADVERIVMQLSAQQAPPSELTAEREELRQAMTQLEQSVLASSEASSAVSTQLIRTKLDELLGTLMQIDAKVEAREADARSFLADPLVGAGGAAAIPLTAVRPSRKWLLWLLSLFVAGLATGVVLIPGCRPPSDETMLAEGLPPGGRGGNFGLHS